MENYIPKEISWLYFNQRVLQESMDQTVPLAERVKYIGIYSNNLDEFYRVRVAVLKRLSKLGKNAVSIIGYDPKETLAEIQKITKQLDKQFQESHLVLLEDLKSKNIYFKNEKELTPKQTEFVENYFNMNIRDKLIPLIITKELKSISLNDGEIYLAVELITEKEENLYFIVDIPTKIFPRFLILPSENNKKELIYLDDVVRLGLPQIFNSFEPKLIEAYTIKITKDAELDIEEDVSASYLDKIYDSLNRRKQASAVRLVYDKNMPSEFRKILINLFHFSKNDALVAGGRYHNFKDFMKFPALFEQKDTNPIFNQIQKKIFLQKGNIFDKISEKDILLHFPYHPFSHFIDLLRESAIDPRVRSIKVTLYRLGGNSSIIKTLIYAAKNGKNVTAVIELQARFDEVQNLDWSEQLSSEGVKVILGVPGLKVHSKLVLITRKERGKETKIAAIGTGNFNEDSSKLYTDFILLTGDRKITNDVTKVFEFLKRNYKKPQFNHLVVSPFTMRNKIRTLIKNEIKNAQNKRKAFIYVKLNNMDDYEIIELLYKASQMGVKVVLLVRGMFSMVIGQKNVSDKIEARGIIDRFLEHSRSYIFCNNNNPQVFIGSADWMTRNIDRRVEVTVPIYANELKKQIIEIFEIHRKDNTKSRDYSISNFNKYFTNEDTFCRAQIEVHRYLSESEENS